MNRIYCLTILLSSALLWWHWAREGRIIPHGLAAAAADCSRLNVHGGRIAAGLLVHFKGTSVAWVAIISRFVDPRTARRLYKLSSEPAVDEVRRRVHERLCEMPYVHVASCKACHYTVV